MNADERNLLAELNAAIDDDGEDVDGIEVSPRREDAAQRRGALASG